MIDYLFVFVLLMVVFLIGLWIGRASVLHSLGKAGWHFVYDAKLDDWTQLESVDESKPYVTIDSRHGGADNIK